MTTAAPTVPDPPDDPDPLFETWPAGELLYRVHHQRFRSTQFNPGPLPGGRFSFFPGANGAQPVPVLYCGGTEESAVAETLFHDIPLTGGRLTADAYLPRNLSMLTAARPLRLVQLHSGGLRRLGLSATSLTDTEASQYPRTVRWAQALHRATTADGLTWMSRRWNSSRAFVLFGDRVAENDLTPLDGGRTFAEPADFEWLAALAHSVRIAVMPAV